MASRPLISVCIPAYNNGQFIASTLESVLAQTCGDFEILITDDKSTDQTVAGINKFADPRIKLIQNEANLGMGGNWNKTLSCARGEYLKLLCGDDVLYPECLQRQVEILEAPSNSDLALAFCASSVIDEHGRAVLRRKFRFREGRLRGHELILGCVRWGTNLIGEPAVGLFRRAAAEKSGGFDASNPYLIDLAFWAEILKQGDAFADSRRLAAFRVSAGSASAKTGLSQAAAFRKFIIKMQRDPAYRPRRWEVLSGRILSWQWCLLRNLFIRVHARRLDATAEAIACR